MQQCRMASVESASFAGDCDLCGQKDIAGDGDFFVGKDFALCASCVNGLREGHLGSPAE